MSIKTPQVWIIRNKDTKEQWTANSGKSSWAKAGYAKSAWSNSMENTTRLERSGIKPIFDKKYSGIYPINFKFKDQDKYEVVKLSTELEDLLKEAVEIIKDFMVYANDRDETDNEFLTRVEEVLGK